MAYEPLNLQNGQTLTAEDLHHMEQGIAGVLPQNPGAYQYPATDGDGNMVWADRLAYMKTFGGLFMNATLQEKTSAGQGHYTYTVTNDVQLSTFPAGWYVLYINGKMYDFSIEEATATTDNLESHNDKIRQDFFTLSLSIVDGKTKFFIYEKTAFNDTLPVSLYAAVPVTIDPKFLPAPVILYADDDLKLYYDSDLTKPTSADSIKKDVMQTGCLPMVSTGSGRLILNAVTSIDWQSVGCKLLTVDYVSGSVVGLDYYSADYNVGGPS